MKTIKPLFPDQESINTAISRLSETDRKRYDDLLLQYQKLITEDAPDHEAIASLMTEAQELLKS